MPIVFTDGRTYGTLCAIGREPAIGGVDDIPMLESFAKLLALELETLERTATDRLLLEELRAQRAALQRSEERFRSLALATAAIVWTTDAEGKLVGECGSWTAFTGQTEEQYTGWGWLGAVHPDDRARIRETWRLRAAQGEVYECEYRLRRSDGRYVHTLARAAPRRDAGGALCEWIGANYDISNRRRGEALLDGQRQALELIAHDSPLAEILAYVTRLIEEHLSVGAQCSILLEQDGTLRFGAAPSLPEAFSRAIDGVAVGPTAGSCGTAIYRRAQVVVVDIATDPLWAEYRDLAAAHGLAACWSTPIVSGGGEVLGSFAIYYAEPRGPTPEEIELVGVATHLAGIAIARHRADMALKERAAALAEADRRKDEFLAMLAHELRNPLAPIVSTVELLRERAAEPSSVEHARVVLDRQARHLTRLVDDLLDVSRITQGKVQLRREPARLEDIVVRALETAEPSLRARGHFLTVDVPPGIVVDVDADRIAQVLSNLVNNAAKFTPPGGLIEVRAVRELGMARLTVRDDGVGLRPDAIDELFELFVQGEATLERSTGGLGIGLTLVRELVSLHGGTVEARSDGPGLGSLFTVKIPLSGEAPRDAGRAPLPGAGARKARKILVVDDNVDAAEMLAAVLRLRGDEVRLAHDGYEALEAAAAFAPETVLLDIGLPGIDGYEVARRLRAARPERALQIVALTGYGQASDRRRALEAGFDDHLVKPVDIARLEALLDVPPGEEIELARSA